jgi:hypothetical protein
MVKNLLSVVLLVSAIFYKGKPKEEDLAEITKSLVSTRPITVSVAELVEIHERGMTVCCGIKPAGSPLKEVSITGMQLIMLDFDDGTDISVTLSDLAKLGIAPNYYYETFSSTEEHRKYRVVIIAEEVLGSETAKSLLQTLLHQLPYADQTCKNLNRLFHGTDKKCVTVDADACLTVSDVDRLLELDKEWVKQHSVPVLAKSKAYKGALNDAIMALPLKDKLDELYGVVSPDGENVNYGHLTLESGKKIDISYYADVNLYTDWHSGMSDNIVGLYMLLYDIDRTSAFKRVCKDYGIGMQTPTNLSYFNVALAEDVMIKLGISYRKNVFTGQTFFVGQAIDDLLAIHNSEVTTENQTIALIRLISNACSTDKNPPDELRIAKIVPAMLLPSQFNPVTELLDSVSYDGKDRFTVLADKLLLSDDDRLLLHVWLLQAMNLINNDGSFAPQGILVLLGKQGVGERNFRKVFSNGTTVIRLCWHIGRK